MDVLHNEKRNSTRLIYHIEHIHNRSIEDYLLEFHNIESPKCKCGCDRMCTIKKRSSPVIWIDYPCGRNGGWSEEAKKSRCSSGNPMNGMTPWNKGLTKDTDHRMYNASKRMLGKKRGPHSEERKEHLRQSTIKAIREGKLCKKTLTTPHRVVNSILREINLEYINEYPIGNRFVADIYLPKYDIYIEVDGDFYHCNPRVYPNGPIWKPQKIAIERDARKNKFCKENGYKLLRYWEYDILSRPDWITQELCKLKK